MDEYRNLTRFIPCEDNLFSIQVYFDSGSIYEKPSEYGYAHFLEHLHFIHSQEHRSKELLAKLDRTSAMHNAVTEKDMVTYFVRGLAKDATPMIDVCLELAFSTVFHDNQLDTQRHIVLEEMYSQSDQEIMNDQGIASILPPKHPYVHPVIGTEAALKHATNRSLKAFHERCERVKNSFIVVFCPEKMIEKCRNHIYRDLRSRFPEIKISSDAPKHIEKPLTPKYEYSIMVKYYDTPQYTTQLTFPGLAADSPHGSIQALVLLCHVLGGSLTSVLYEEMRTRRGLVYSIQVQPIIMKYMGFVKIEFSSSEDAIASKSIEHVMHALSPARLKSKVTAHVLEKHRHRYLARRAMWLSSFTERTFYMGNTMFYCRDYDEAAYTKAIREVTIEDVLKTAKTIFRGDRMGIVYGGPISPESEEKILDKLEIIRKNIL